MSPRPEILPSPNSSSPFWHQAFFSLPAWTAHPSLDPAWLSLALSDPIWTWQVFLTWTWTSTGTPRGFVILKQWGFSVWTCLNLGPRQTFRLETLTSAHLEFWMSLLYFYFAISQEKIEVRPFSLAMILELQDRHHLEAGPQSLWHHEQG